MVRDAVAQHPGDAELDGSVIARRCELLGEMVTPEPRVDDHATRLRHEAAGSEGERTVAHDLALHRLGHHRVHQPGREESSDVALVVEGWFAVRVAVTAIDAANQVGDVSCLERADRKVVGHLVGCVRSIRTDDLVADRASVCPRQIEAALCQVALRRSVPRRESVGEAHGDEPPRTELADLTRGQREAAVEDSDEEGPTVEDHLDVDRLVTRHHLTSARFSEELLDEDLELGRSLDTDPIADGTRTHRGGHRLERSPLSQLHSELWRQRRARLMPGPGRHTSSLEGQVQRWQVASRCPP